MTEDSLSFVPTRATLMQNENVEFQAVTYKSYKSKHNEKLIGETKSVDTKKETEFNIKKLKHEIVKFGISGLDPYKKEEAKVQLAIKLGAKPPKNKYVNYKVLQSKRKKEKDKETVKLNFQQLGKNSSGKSTAKGKSFDRKRRKEKGGILGRYGNVQVSTKSN